MRLVKAVGFGLTLIFGGSYCGNNDPTAPRTDIIVVTPDATSKNLAPGSTETISLVVSRPIGYTGSITLNVEGVPNGVNASLTPSVLAPQQNTSILSLAASSQASTGSGSIIIRATGTGIEPQTTSIELTVSSEPGGFTISVSPTTMVAVRNGTATGSINIVRTGGFNGAVSMDVSGFPIGVIATISPGVTTSSFATLTLNVGAQVPGGFYSGIVSAQASGAGVQSTSVILSVTP